MFKNRTFVAIGILAFALCLIIYWGEHRTSGEVTTTARVSTRVIAANARAKPIDSAKRSRSAAASAHRIDPKIESFDSATDLATFVAANTEVAMHGDAAAARQISKAY